MGNGATTARSGAEFAVVINDPATKRVAETVVTTTKRQTIEPLLSGGFVDIWRAVFVKNAHCCAVLLFSVLKHSLIMWRGESRE